MLTFLKDRIKIIIQKAVSLVDYPHVIDSGELKNAKKYILPSNEIKCIQKSSMVYKLPDNAGFFRECEKHTEEKEYIFSMIKDYYDFLRTTFDDDSNIIYEDESNVLNCLHDQKNYELFVSMGSIFPNSGSACRNFIDGIVSAQAVGLNAQTKEAEERLRLFVKYAGGKIYTYKLNNRLPINSYHGFYSSRQFAYQKMAELMGFSEWVPNSEYAFLCIDNKNMFGTVMDTAKGVPAKYLTFEQRKNMITPKFQKAMLDLNILDVLCYMRDHSPYNYNVVVSNDKLDSISVYDNDEPEAFSYKTNTDFETWLGCSPLINKKGLINRPCLSEDSVNLLMKIKYADIKRELTSYLSNIKCLAIYIRLRRLRKAIRKTVKVYDNFLIGENEWGNDLIQRELSGVYGKTYLGSFLTECYEMQPDESHSNE